MAEISKDLQEFLDAFEDAWHMSGINKISGGYTKTEYKSQNRSDIYFILHWGIISSPDDIEEHIEYCKISKYNFKKSIDVLEKIKLVKYIDQEIFEKYKNHKDELNARARKRFANDPEYREKIKAQQKEWQRKKIADDPEYKKKINIQRREKYANDPEFWEKEKIRRKKQWEDYDSEYKKKREAKSYAIKKEKYESDPEFRKKILAKQSEWRKEQWANNPEYREKIKAQLKKARDNNPEFRKNARKSNLKRQYGMTPEEYDQMLEEQDGRCKICGTHQSELKRRLAIDHCHKSGKIRGLLCADCNTGIGHLKDDPKILEKAKQYLESFSE